MLLFAAAFSFLIARPSPAHAEDASCPKPNSQIVRLDSKQSQVLDKVMDLAGYEKCQAESVLTNALLYPAYEQEACRTTGKANDVEKGTKDGQFTHLRKKEVCRTKDSVTWHYVLFSDDKCEKSVVAGFTSSMIFRN